MSPGLRLRSCHLHTPPLHNLPCTLAYSDSASRLIFLEQWCQLFIPPLPSLFHPTDCDWFPSLLSVTLAQSTADAPILMPQEIPLSTVCVICLRSSCQSISLLCFECQKLWVCERSGSVVEWKLMRLYVTALGDAKHVSFCYELRWNCPFPSGLQLCQPNSSQRLLPPPSHAAFLHHHMVVFDNMS